MLHTVGDPLVGTFVVTAALLLAAALSARKTAGGPRLDEARTTALKGAAALGVIFCHVGYFLVDDHRFLFPLSAGGGVAVDLFLLLSGFGLAVGAFKKVTRPLAFYRRRVAKLFGPLWLSLAAILALDYWRLGLAYQWREVVPGFAGVITSANLFGDLNSPLWYVTLSLFFYAVFPWLFQRQHPMRSVALLCAASYAWSDWVAPRLLPGVAGLYGLHRFAFPLGVLLASLMRSETLKGAWRRAGAAKWQTGQRAVMATALVAAAGYLTVHSGVGRGADIEEATSLAVTLLLVVAAAVSPWRIGALAALGAVSYEVYLLHWPLLARHGLFPAALPSWAAMLLALVLLYIAGLALRFVIAKFSPPVGGGRDLVS